MTTVGYRGRRSRRPQIGPARPGSVLTVPTWALRILQRAEGRGPVEFRERGGRLQFRTDPEAAWRPIEDVADLLRPVQLTAALGAEKEIPQ